jgi:hypothetical protein
MFFYIPFNSFVFSDTFNHIETNKKATTEQSETVPGALAGEGTRVTTILV